MSIERGDSEREEEGEEEEEEEEDNKEREGTYLDLCLELLNQKTRIEFFIDDGVVLDHRHSLSETTRTDRLINMSILNRKCGNHDGL